MCIVSAVPWKKSNIKITIQIHDHLVRFEIVILDDEHHGRPATRGQEVNPQPISADAGHAASHQQ
jgi:hypothetical protein